MATVRKRMLPSGKVVWVAGYKDGGGARRFKQFGTRRQADAFLTRAKAEVAVGTHVADRQASTVDDAYGLLITELEAESAARSTIENYKSYYKGHVKPFLAKRLLSRLQAADVADWLKDLKAAGRTDDTRRRARIVLGAIFDEAIRRRLAFSNPVRAGGRVLLVSAGALATSASLNPGPSWAPDRRGPRARMAPGST
jgi:integrase